MHWLLLLAVLSSTTNLNPGGSTASMNRLAEDALRRQIGGANTIRVDLTPGKNKTHGDFDVFNVTLDGFAADRLMGLADRSARTPRDGDNGSYPGDYGNGGFPQRDDSGDMYPLRPRNLEPDILGDILGGGLGDVLGGGGLGDILGGVLGGKTGGRIGRIRLRATNFTFQGARYNALDASLGEVRFDWTKALRGDFDVKSIQPGTLGLSLSADQTARLLGPRLPSIRDLKVRFANGLAYVGGKTDFYGVKVPFEVGGRLSVQANQVRADNIRVSVSKLRLPSIVMDELTRGVNPLYDFDPQGRWPLAINLQAAGTANNALALNGGIQWRGFNNGSADRNGNNRNRRVPNRDGNPDNYPDDVDANRTPRKPGGILGDIFGR